MNVFERGKESFRRYTTDLKHLNGISQVKVAQLNEHIHYRIYHDFLRSEIERQNESLRQYEKEFLEKRLAKENALRKYEIIINSPAMASNHFASLYTKYASKWANIPASEWIIPLPFESEVETRYMRYSLDQRAACMALSSRIHYMKRCAIEKFTNRFHTSRNAAKARINYLDEALSHLTSESLSLSALVFELESELALVKRRICKIKQEIDHGKNVPEHAEAIYEKYRSMAVCAFERCQNVELVRETINVGESPKMPTPPSTIFDAGFGGLFRRLRIYNDSSCPSKAEPAVFTSNANLAIPREASDHWFACDQDADRGWGVDGHIDVAEEETPNTDWSPTWTRKEFWNPRDGLATELEGDQGSIGKLIPRTPESLWLPCTPDFKISQLPLCRYEEFTTTNKDPYARLLTHSC